LPLQNIFVDWVGLDIQCPTHGKEKAFSRSTRRPRRFRCNGESSCREIQGQGKRHEAHKAHEAQGEQAAQGAEIFSEISAARAAACKAAAENSEIPWTRPPAKR